MLSDQTAYEFGKRHASRPGASSQGS
jgi:hypothetical protein